MKTGAEGRGKGQRKDGLRRSKKVSEQEAGDGAIRRKEEVTENQKEREGHRAFIYFLFEVFSVGDENIMEWFNGVQGIITSRRPKPFICFA